MLLVGDCFYFGGDGDLFDFDVEWVVGVSAVVSVESSFDSEACGIKVGVEGVGMVCAVFCPCVHYAVGSVFVVVVLFGGGFFREVADVVIEVVSLAGEWCGRHDSSPSLSREWFSLVDTILSWVGLSEQPWIELVLTRGQ